MDKTFVLAVIITILFCATKYVEQRFLDQDPKPLKEVVRDALVVLVCSITGSFGFFHFQGTLIDFFNAVTETKALNPVATEIFTDVPAF